MRALLACLLLALAGCDPRPKAAEVAMVTICPPGSQPLASGSCSPAAVAPVGKKETFAVAASPKEGPSVQEKPGPRKRFKAELQGRWHGEDSDAWGYYELTISADGTFRQEITQIASLSTGPRTCVQEGDLTLDGENLLWHYVSNDCNSDFQGQTEPHPIVEMGVGMFVERHGSYTIHYERPR